MQDEIGAAERDDVVTERVESVLPPAQVLKVDQQPIELVKIPVSRAAEQIFETGIGERMIAPLSVCLPRVSLGGQGMTRGEKLSAAYAARVPM